MTVDTMAAPVAKPGRLRTASGWLGVVLGLILLLNTGLSYWASMYRGFPDGYVSPYERETLGLSNGLDVASFFFGLLGLVYGFGVITGSLRPSRVRTLLLRVLVLGFAAIVLLGLMLGTCPHSQTCSEVYERVTGHWLDDGHGG